MQQLQMLSHTLRRVSTNTSTNAEDGHLPLLQTFWIFFRMAEIQWLPTTTSAGFILSTRVGLCLSDVDSRSKRRYVFRKDGRKSCNRSLNNKIREPWKFDEGQMGVSNLIQDGICKLKPLNTFIEKLELDQCHYNTGLSGQFFILHLGDLHI